MNDIQALQFNILIKLDEVCRRHNLKYYLAYGTCIGAVRHKGFIPWDHDIDVLMPFDDVRKLVKYQDEFGQNYYVSDYKNDKSNLTTKVLIYDRNHRCQIIKNGHITEIINVCMDIYPFYNCPSSRIGLLLNIWRSHAYKILVGGIPQNHGKFVKLIGRIILLFVSKSRRKNVIIKIEQKLNYKGNSYEIADYYGLDITFISAITYKREWFGEPTELEFEGRYFYGPTDSDKYLTRRYGDYMTPPLKKDLDNEVRVELI